MNLTFKKTTLSAFTASNIVIVIPYKEFIFFSNEKYNIVAMQERENDTFTGEPLAFHMADIQKLISLKKSVSSVGQIVGVENNSPVILFNQGIVKEQIPTFFQLSNSISTVISEEVIPAMISKYGIRIEPTKTIDKPTYIVSKEQVVKNSEGVREVKQISYACKRHKNVDHEIALFHEIPNTETLPLDIFPLNPLTDFSKETLLHHIERNMMTLVINDNFAFLSNFDVGLLNEGQNFAFWFEYANNNSEDAKDATFIIDYIKQICINPDVKIKIKSFVNKRDRRFSFSQKSNTFAITTVDKKVVDLSIDVEMKIEKSIMLSPILLNICLLYLEKIVKITNLTKENSKHLIYLFELNDGSFIIIY